jgi:hypothetical protein
LALLELRVRLNASEVLSSFAGDMRGAVAQLQALDPPIDPAALNSAASGASSIDLSSLSNAAERIVEQITGTDIDIPDPAAIVASITSVLDLVEELDPRQLETSVRAALERATNELKAPRTGSFDAIIERITAVLSDSPEGQQIGRILGRIIELAGADAAVLTEVKAILPAVLGVIRAVGGIMRVETVLSEAERLTVTMQSQVNASVTTTELASIGAGIEYAVERLTAAAANADLEAEAERATLEALQRIDLVRDAVARRLAFGESTLLFADLDRALAEVRLGLEEASQVDLQAAGATIARLIDRVMPAFSLPLPPAPADSLAAMLDLIETHVQSIAQRIEAIDVTRVGAPVASLAGAITRPVRELDRIGTELMNAARGAIDGLTAVVENLPTDEVTDAVESATEPVRDALDAITDVIGDIEEGLTDAAAAATGFLGTAEEAVDTFTSALQGVITAAADFVRDLNLDATVGQLDEQLAMLRSALEQANVRPYFSAAVDAIDAAASVLENVPVVLLPDDVKEEFDTLVEPIRSLNIDAVAGEVESWFELEEGKFPFEPELQASLDEISQALTDLLAAIEPHHPRLLAQSIDAELAPLRTQIDRLDINAALAPLDDAINSVKGVLDDVDPTAALQPVSSALHEVANKLDEFKPGALLAPIQERIVAAREAVIAATRLEVAAQALTDLEREAVALMMRVDPVRIEPEIAAALAVARQELSALDRYSFSQWVGPLLSSIMGGDGARRRPATWNAILAWLMGDEAASALRLRAQRIVNAVNETATSVSSLDITVTANGVTTGLTRINTAVQSFAAGSPIRVRLEDAVRRRGTDGGFVSLGVNATRFSGELETARATAGPLLQLELSRVDVTAAALRAVGAPVIQLRNQLFGMLRQVGIRSVNDGLGAILGELLDVVTPQRASAILVPIYTALRGRAEALIGSILGPLRTALNDLLSLLRLIDLTQITEGLDNVVDAGKLQILSLDPITVLQPTLTAFDNLRNEVRNFDPLAPVRTVVNALRDTARRILDKLSVERLIEPASQVFDELLQIVRDLDPNALVMPLVEALRTLATDIHDGLGQLRAALVRLQEAIPSTEGLALAGAVDVDVDLGF